MYPFITVVMPVRNESHFIKSTIEQVLHQDYPQDRYEIIVADGMSDDGTQEIVTQLAINNPQIRLFDNPKRLSSAGRNIGFKNGRGDYFLVVDGHCFIPSDQLFRNLVRCFEESGADCLGRPQPLDPPGLTDFQKAVALARASRIGRSGSSLIYSDYEGAASPVSNGAAYRKEVFESIGYVDESFDAAEDVEFNYRVEQAGLKAFTSPAVEVKYYPRGNLRGLFRQLTRYGYGRFRLLEKHSDSFSIESLVPPAFLFGLIVLLATGWVFLKALYGVYLALILGSSLNGARKHGWRYLFFLPAIYVTIHSGLGWGFLKGLAGFLSRKKGVIVQAGAQG
jgi:glycosyltransferase involved in cell wall biosynthesis